MSWLIGMLVWLWEFLVWLVGFSWRWTVDFVQRRPMAALFAVWGLLQLFGALVTTGWHGVLFSGGRARRVLDPGFHYLIPIWQQVRKIPTRSRTLDLSRQRIVTADELVYEVDTNLIYRVTDPIKAFVEVDDLERGLLVVGPLAVREILQGRSRSELLDRAALEAALADNLAPRLAAWGVTVEYVGFTNIAPTAATLRLTQLRMRVQERVRMLTHFSSQGLPLTESLMLLGSERQVVGKARPRYRAKRQHPAGRRPSQIGRRHAN